MIVAELGGPEGLRAAELPDPVAEPGQVVVRVRAVCVHPADIGARTGMIPGGPVPVQALSLLGLDEPATVLVTGASGGVGGFATQPAARRGHRVLAVASDGDEAWVSGLGAAEVIPRSADLASVGPVPAVLDAVPVGEAATAAVADGGTVVTTRPTPPIDPSRGVNQQLQLVRLDRGSLAELVRELAAGTLRTRVAAEMPLTEAAEAHRLVEAGGLRGKVVLTVG